MTRFLNVLIALLVAAFAIVLSVMTGHAQALPSDAVPQPAGFAQLYFVNSLGGIGSTLKIRLDGKEIKLQAKRYVLVSIPSGNHYLEYRSQHFFHQSWKPIPFNAERDQAYYFAYRLEGVGTLAFRQIGDLEGQGYVGTLRQQKPTQSTERIP